MPGKTPRYGFTLIELMIVVAIIGILAAIAIPKFADLIKKSKEGKTRGNLAVIRSALAVYYGDAEGQWPLDVDVLTANQKYLKDSPPCVIPDFPDVANPGHAQSNGDPSVAEFDSSTDVGDWQYVNVNTSVNWGHFWVGCAHNDSKSIIWNTR